MTFGAFGVRFGYALRALGCLGAASVCFGHVVGALGCLGDLGRLWRAKGPLEATTVAPWGDFGGSWGAFGGALGYSWVDLGGSTGGLGGQMRGHRAIWGSKGPLEGSRDHFGVVLGSKKWSF